MGNGNYRVVLTGSILEGFERGPVVATVAKLFKCPEQQAERLLQGESTALKREMDAATAERYQQQLTKVGIASRLEAVAAPELVLELSSDAEPAGASAAAPVAASPAPSEKTALSLEPIGTAAADSTAAATAEGQAGFHCPKCGTPQEKGEECIKCGIIFSRYQPDVSGADEAPTAPAEEDALSELDELALFVGEDWEKYRFKFTQLNQNSGQYKTQWHWPAFLAPLPWLIYRKLYPWAAVLLLVQIVLPPIALLMVGISMGLLGNFLYYRHAMQRIGKIAATDAERADEIAQAGGTNSLLLTIGATVLAGILMGIMSYLFFMPPEAKQAMEKQAEARQEFEQVGDDKTKQKMLLLKNLLGMQKATMEMVDKSFEMPRDMEELRKMLGADAKATADEWGSQMDLEVEGNSLTFYSPGPDLRFDTADDVVFKTELR